jgi:hypothetical protein
MIPAVLSVIIAFSILASAVIEVTLTNFSIVSNSVKSQQAFNIAEAGLNYYLWHLNHNSTDYKDGQSTPTTPTSLGYGPYTHQYIDTNGIDEGTYTLYIQPPATGSTIVTVESIGTVDGITRTVQAQLGSPSFASYGVVSDSALWFGNTETADGPVDSNQGIRMDGPNTSTVSSANSSYVPSAELGGNGSTSEPGVWCSSSVTSPVNCNTRSKSDWTYPVSNIDFNQVSSSLCTMKKVAFGDYSSTSSLVNQSNACTQTPSTRTNAYIPETSTSFSSTKGYLIKLNSNDTYDLLKVNSENDQLSPYTSALSTTAVATGISLPPSGVIFVEDNVWVLTPTTFNGRVTIASGRLASSTYSTDVVIAGPLLYAAKDGSDEIGLVAEDSIFIAPYAPASASGYSSGSFNFEVDGALLAENGNVEYGENGDSASYPAGYRTAPSTCAKGWTGSNQTLTFYGSVATRQTWTWSWLVGNNPCGNAAYSSGNGYITGFLNDTTDYDYNLEYGPPPSYPVTAGYNILSWREILTHP